MMALPLLLASALLEVTGIVTFAREGLPFCFVQDMEGKPWRVACIKGFEPTVGDRILAKGEREESSKRRLATEEGRILENDTPALPDPQVIAIPLLFREIMPFGHADWYGRTFTTEGLLRDINRRQQTTQLLVGDGPYTLMVELPVPLDEPLPHELVLGATLRVTGALAYTSIENFSEGIFGRIENVELIPFGRASVEVIHLAPFWTVGRLLAVTGSLLALSLLMIVWVLTLRRMVAKRSQQLAESIRARETTRIEADASRRERLRLAADLHDGFQQYLAGAMFRLKAARNYLFKDVNRCSDQLEKVKEALQYTQNGLRATLWAMNEESEGPDSLIELLNFVLKRMPHCEKIVEVTSRGTPRPVTSRFSGSLLLVMQEAVGNAIRHGGATRIRIVINFLPQTLDLLIADDGVGFDSSIAREEGHYGLQSMARRIEEVGGKITIESKIGKGTAIICTIPC